MTRLVGTIMGGFLVLLIVSCAATKKLQPASSLEVIVVEQNGARTYFYPASFDTTTSSLDKKTTYTFFNSKGAIIAKKTMQPFTRVIINDYSRKTEFPTTGTDWIK